MSAELVQMWSISCDADGCNTATGDLGDFGGWATVNVADPAVAGERWDDEH